MCLTVSINRSASVFSAIRHSIQEAHMGQCKFCRNVVKVLRKRGLAIIITSQFVITVHIFLDDQITIL